MPVSFKTLLKLNITAVVMGLLIFSTACDKKRSSRNAPARMVRSGQPMNPGDGSGVGGGQQQGFTPYNGTTGSEWAYLRGQDGFSFRRTVQSFVSASMDPNELGQINEYGDVALIGYMDVADQQGNLNRGNSRLRIEIWDSYAREGSAPEIAIAFNSLSSYQYNGNQVRLVFQDDYGQVLIDGQFSGNDFYGTVSFQNSVSFLGNSSPASGTLGSFQVPICGFFRCQ